jgi:hypothetical protein
MTDRQTNERLLELVASLQAANKAVTGAAEATQERNLAFVQAILEQGIEVLKQHAEASRALIQEVVERAKSEKPSEGLQALADQAMAAQERNTSFAQEVFENGIEALKSQVGITRTLMQELGKQGQKQQAAFQSLTQQSVDAYLSFFRTPFTYYQQALDAAEVATRQALERFQQATQQSLEYMQQATQQARQSGRKGNR